MSAVIPPAAPYPKADPSWPAERRIAHERNASAYYRRQRERQQTETTRSDNSLMWIAAIPIIGWLFS